jgi:hypothetical protein
MYLYFKKNKDKNFVLFINRRRCPNLEGNWAKIDTNRTKPTQQLNRVTPTLADDTSKRRSHICYRRRILGPLP